MSIEDIGPEPQSFDLETETLANTAYRTVAWSGKHLQLTLMSIPMGEDIGLEVHPDTDQFLRLDGGRGRVQMGPSRDQLDFEQEVEDGWAIFVPATTRVRTLTRMPRVVDIAATMCRVMEADMTGLSGEPLLERI